MINKLILVEGKNDKLFVDWLVKKVFISIPDNMKLIQVGGKPNFTNYLMKVSDRLNDTENQIDYGENQISAILLIKDFDLDDQTNEFSNEMIDFCKQDILLEKYYISGAESPPEILETLFICNDGELLRNFASVIKQFSENSVNKLKKVNDKNIFEAYLKLQNGRIEYSAEILDAMFAVDKFLELTDIKNLINKIQEFIKD